MSILCFLNKYPGLRHELTSSWLRQVRSGSAFPVIPDLLADFKIAFDKLPFRIAFWICELPRPRSRDQENSCNRLFFSSSRVALFGCGATAKEMETGFTILGGIPDFIGPNESGGSRDNPFGIVENDRRRRCGRVPSSSSHDLIAFMQSNESERNVTYKVYNTKSRIFKRPISHWRENVSEKTQV